MSSIVEIEERERVVYLHVPEPARGTSAERLAWAIEDACIAIEEEVEPYAGVVLSDGGGAFLLWPPADRAEWSGHARAAARITGALARLSAPTVASMAFDAIGPAWEVALACDVRVAADGVRLGSPDVQADRVPSAGATQRLPQLVGVGVALRLLLLGELLTADEALRLGLVHLTAPPSQLAERGAEVVALLQAAAPIALAYAKEAVRVSADLPLADGLRLEADLAALLQTTTDRAEGLRSFLERRAPRFGGS
jgi:enoyl-CoA hydratase